ncbi:MAG: hypothetical protein LUB59_06515 [Candidatus Gastranaerophilales bacterium]|nr:hypothetical protein [Candidatus Gastranaerophilales bacterium]
MNTISFTPQNINYTNNVTMKNRMAAPVFTAGKPKIPAAGEVKKTANLAQKIYKALFLPQNETITAVKDGNVFTRVFSADGTERISTKYKKFSSKPQSIVKDNRITKLREITDMNKDGTVNVKINDMYTPEYNVSVGYSHINPESYATETPIKIGYGDKEYTITKEQSEEMRNDFSKVLNEKFNKSPRELKQLEEKELDKYISDFYTTPETTATAILLTPAALEEQLEMVPRALPYGIECIIDKLAK